jgi:hypothetical protein
MILDDKRVHGNMVDPDMYAMTTAMTTTTPFVVLTFCCLWILLSLRFFFSLSIDTTGFI